MFQSFLRLSNSFKNFQFRLLTGLLLVVGIFQVGFTQKLTSVLEDPVINNIIYDYKLQDWSFDKSSVKNQQDVIFDATELTFGFLPLTQADTCPPAILLDYGITNGGHVDSFKIGYATDLRTPVSMCIRFYSGTNESKFGVQIDSFVLNNLPGSTNGNNQIFSVMVDAGESGFCLPPGYFGYGYDIKDKRTGPLTTSNTGSNVADGYYLPPYPEIRKIPNFFAQFYMELRGDINTHIGYVDNSFAGAGDGSFTKPFSDIDDALVTEITDIHVAVGNGPYSDFYVLLDNQTLTGAGSGRDGCGNVVPGSDERPHIEGLTFGNNNTVSNVNIENNDIGLTLHNVTNATVSDVNVSSTITAIDINAGTGTFTFKDVTVNAPEESALKINGGSANVNILNSHFQMSDIGTIIDVFGGQSGDFVIENSLIEGPDGSNVKFRDLSPFAFRLDESEMRGIDIEIARSTGNFSGNVVELEGGLRFQNSDVFTSLTDFRISFITGKSAINVINDNGTIDFEGTIDARSGDGLQFDNADGVYGFRGNVHLNGGDAGIDILGGSNGQFTFTDTDIINPTGIGLNIHRGSPIVNFNGKIVQNNNSSAVNILNNTSKVNFDGLIDATAGDGLQFGGSDGEYDFRGIIKLNGGDAGIDILGFSTGQFTFTNTDITNPTNTGLTIDGGSSTVIFDQGSSITQNNNASAVKVTEHNGSIEYNGQLDVNNGDGLQFDDADGTYDFRGQVRLNGGDAGIDILDGAAGQFTFAPIEASQIDGPAISLTESAADINLNALIVNGAATALNLINFTGQLKIEGDGTVGSGGIIENSNFLTTQNTVTGEHMNWNGTPVILQELSIGGGENKSLQTGMSFTLIAELLDQMTIDIGGQSTGNIDFNFENSRLDGLFGGGLSIEIQDGIEGNITLTNNTIKSAGDIGLNIKTNGSSDVVVDLSDNEVSGSVYDFQLWQNEGSIFNLKELDSRDSAKVVAHVQEQNAGVPTVNLIGFMSSQTTPTDDLIYNRFRVGQNYPNPFQHATTIPFTFDDPKDLEIKIHDISGQLIRTLATWKTAQDSKELYWNGRNDLGQLVPEGMYVLRLSDGRISQVRKMLLIRQ